MTLFFSTRCLSAINRFTYMPGQAENFHFTLYLDMQRFIYRVRAIDPEILQIDQTYIESSQSCSPRCMLRGRNNQNIIFSKWKNMDVKLMILLRMMMMRRRIPLLMPPTLCDRVLKRHLLKNIV